MRENRFIRSAVMATVSVLIAAGCRTAAPTPGSASHAPDLVALDAYTLAGPRHLVNGYPPNAGDDHVNVVVEIPAGTNAKWEVDKAGLVMVSTDGHRLAKVEIKMSLGDVDKTDVIVPPKALSTFRSYAEKDELIKVTIGDNSITFEMKDVSIYSRLLEGPFPNYQKVIPVKNEKELQPHSDCQYNRTGAFLP